MLIRRWPDYKKRPIKHISGLGLCTETKDPVPKELYGKLSCNREGIALKVSNWSHQR